MKTSRATSCGDPLLGSSKKLLTMYSLSAIFHLRPSQNPTIQSVYWLPLGLIILFVNTDKITAVFLKQPQCHQDLSSAQKWNESFVYLFIGWFKYWGVLQYYVVFLFPTQLYNLALLKRVWEEEIDSNTSQTLATRNTKLKGFFYHYGDTGIKTNNPLGRQFCRW